MTLQTSPRNYQAWVAVEGVPRGNEAEKEEANDFARRLRKGAGADLTASGATRIAGSFNFKTKYAPAFPTVELAHVSLGKIVTASELEGMGLVASSEPPRQAEPGRAPIYRGRRPLPDYQRCVDEAPPNRSNTGPDISIADFRWCLLALDRGYSTEATAARLTELSTKARSDGEKIRASDGPKTPPYS